MLRGALAVTAAIAAALVASGEVSARKRMHVGGRIGFGVALGAPTALTLDASLSDRWDFELAGGSDPIEDGRWYGHAGFTVTLKDLAIRDYFMSVPVYSGLSATAIDDGEKFGDEIRWGVRVPFGIAADTGGAPFRMYLELAPRFDIRPEFGLSFSGVIGFRFFPGGG